MKKLLAIILACAMLLSLAACGGTAPEAGGEAGGEELGLVGFCSVSLSESIYVLTQEALENIFEGKAVVQTVSCDNDSATQISQIKTFVTMGADLIVINPTDVDALSDAIIEAHNAGVKVYINGATSKNLSEEYYDCCTVSNEYLIGAYVALIAKNWIEAHADELTAANPNWEVAFLQSSLSEETLERSAGEMAILEPYLKDYEGNYIDISGNIVDEANKVENPAYCKIAADRYKGVIVEQDQTNGGLNVANILTTNPNTRVFIAYNSLASTQGGQYIVDNYPDQINEFAFFSSGVMGNEADYMVGSVSATDGVTPSVMRGACQFGVSAAGGEVADSVANTAYAIMYGEEGVDYVKNNIDGIAAWWTVDEEWGNGTAHVAHFNILSGATVQAFDPIAALTDANTVTYWNSKDGFVEKEAAAEAPAAPETPAEVVPGAYTYEYEGQGGLETAEFNLAEDGTCKFFLPGHPFITDEYAGTYTREGNVVTITGLKHVDPTSPYQIPGLWDFIDAATGDAVITVDDAKGTFVPGAAEAPAAAAVPAGEYTYLEATPFGEMKWVITLNEDGTAVFGQPENAGMGNPSWTAVWTDNGDGTFTTAECVGEGPQIAGFWENNSIVWQLLNDNCAVPVKADDYAAHVDAHGIPTGAAAASVAAGEYTFMETTPFGEMKWVVTLNEDGTAVVAQPENEGMGNPTWTAVWTDNGDGTFITAECEGSGPQIASFWNNNSITWTDNGDGTVTPVGYTG